MCVEGDLGRLSVQTPSSKQHRLGADDSGPFPVKFGCLQAIVPLAIVASR